MVRLPSRLYSDFGHPPGPSIFFCYLLRGLVYKDRKDFCLCLFFFCF
ncbi:hypothetical protein LptCag_1544 [Leptospirillum ferriphilum]|uniref:Uncharacterized protein n=1 Tax=Leptospirillum ferriphilum TaxID=178606 RepID=A0A094X5K4_9BACT|nr:hypothetical protein LptCag_1544 [Leptospirillum ferriphilum]